eukprot:339412_1
MCLCNNGVGGVEYSENNDDFGDIEVMVVVEVNMMIVVVLVDVLMNRGCGGDLMITLMNRIIIPDDNVNEPNIEVNIPVTDDGKPMHKLLINQLIKVPPPAKSAPPAAIDDS